MNILGHEHLNWQPVVYFLSFGSLMASIVAGAFSPFCRKRRPESDRLRAAKPARETILGDRDRMSHAIRQWSTVRADADLACAPLALPPAPEMQPEPVTQAEPARGPEPEPIPQPAAIAIERREPETPPVQPASEGQSAAESAAEEGTRSVAEPNPFLNADFHGAPNFYEILQISQRADLETIHRVYRIMAARFHPDNPVSGDHEMFLKLCEAYEVLSRPERRAQYDTALRSRETEPIPIFGDRIFVDGLDGELNRRFGILALLYQRRRTNQGNVGVSTLDLESRMSLPREHLEFTLWYLRSKGYVQIQEDNSDYAVTALGVDFVEANSARNPILRELLTAGCPTSRPVPHQSKRRGFRAGRRAQPEQEVAVAG